MNRLRSLFLLLVLLLTLIPLQVSIGQGCPVTPVPSPTPTPTYSDLVLATQSAHLLAYWKLEETSGTTANDSSGNGRNATYSGATLNATTFLTGNPAPSFDGVNDFVNVYSAINAVFNGQEGTLTGWAQVASSSEWTDGSVRQVALLNSGSGAFAQYRKATVNNTLTGRYMSVDRNIGSTTTTNWFFWALTWTYSGNAAKVYLNGSQQGTTITGFAQWTAALISSTATLGASSTAGASPWHGNIAQVALWNTPLTSGEITTLATVPTISPTITPYPTCTPTNTFTPTDTFTPTNTFTPSPTDTFTPGPTPTASLTPTETLTPSPGPSPTLTFTLTPSNTASIYDYMTVIPPGETTGRSFVLVHQVTLGDAMQSSLLFVLVVILTLTFIRRLRGR